MSQIQKSSLIVALAATAVALFFLLADTSRVFQAVLVIAAGIEWYGFGREALRIRALRLQTRAAESRRRREVEAQPNTSTAAPTAEQSDGRRRSDSRTDWRNRRQEYRVPAPYTPRAREVAER
jgi:hypothetical protein